MFLCGQNGIAKTLLHNPAESGKMGKEKQPEEGIVTIYFTNDYNRGAHPAVLAALQQTNGTSYPGYGTDDWCRQGADAIRRHLGDSDAEIHFMVGGTQVNLTVIAAALRPYQSVICAATGHINAHEAGSIEHTGHKILALPPENGKLTAEAVRREAERYRQSGEAEYLTQPKLVFLSFPSESGTIYSKTELTALHAVCREYGMYLYVDGARLPYGLTAVGCNVTLADLASLTDAFYLGGTKCGALFGEAVVLCNPVLRDHFRTYLKQFGAMLAKGWLLGLQFAVLLENNRYFESAREANRKAMRLKAAFKEKGIPFWMDSPTNQQFVILSDAEAKALSENFGFEINHRVDADHICARFCTGWSTQEEELNALIAAVEAL